MGLPLLLCPELICRVLICRVPDGGWSRSLDALSAPPQRLLQSAKRECQTRRNRALPEFASCSRRQARGRHFLCLRESPENARAISAAPGSSATSRPNCAASVRPDELVEAAALAARSLCQVRSCWLPSATMRANAISFRFEAGLRFCRCLSSQLEPVVMLLNDEGGRQQSLKGLLVQRQVGTVRGHGIWGRRTVQT